MSKRDFYIGWQAEAPGSFAKVARLFLLTVLLLGLLFAFFFSRSQRGFIDSYFDYGNLTTLEGTLVQEPIPALLTMVNGNRLTVPLVGFGKFGADAALDQIALEVEGEDLTALRVTVRGTLFNYGDKQWMELTEGAASLVAYEIQTRPKRHRQDLGIANLAGEIIDPKCFFGVMNPGTKAVHRSCAIRCIAGGVPAILGIREAGVFKDYYFLLDREGRPVGSEILPYVGIPISLRGRVGVVDDWKTLTLDDVQSSVLSQYISNSTVCQ